MGTCQPCASLFKAVLYINRIALASPLRPFFEIVCIDEKTPENYETKHVRRLRLDRSEYELGYTCSVNRRCHNSAAFGDCWIGGKKGSEPKKVKKRWVYSPRRISLSKYIKQLLVFICDGNSLIFSNQAHLFFQGHTSTRARHASRAAAEFFVRDSVFWMHVLFLSEHVTYFVKVVFTLKIVKMVKS